jgi:putative PIN family toxin of toxin-antitoxin system
VRKAVFDTNIYISALTTKGGRAEEVWLLAVDGRVEVYTSAAILAEMAGKLREKFHWKTNGSKGRFGISRLWPRW